MSRPKWRWVGYICETCERGHVKDFEQRSRNGVAVNSFSVYFKNDVLNLFNPIKENDDPYI